MLENISGIKSLKEGIEAVEKRITALEDRQKEIAASVKSVENSILELNGAEKGYSDTFSKDLEKIKELQKEFEKALRTFQQNNSQL